MHSNILTIGLAAIACIVPTVVGSCNGAKGIITDCCWGGTNNVDACNRQLKSASACFRQDQNYCGNNGITPAQCDADCCSISQKIGIGCPK